MILNADALHIPRVPRLHEERIQKGTGGEGMKMLFVSDEMLQMVANGEELYLPEEISINEIAEFSASKLLEARQRIHSLEHDHKVMREALESIGKVCDQATNIKVATYDTVDDVSDLSRTALSSLLVKDGEK